MRHVRLDLTYRAHYTEAETTRVRPSAVRHLAWAGSSSVWWQGTWEAWVAKMLGISLYTAYDSVECVNTVGCLETLHSSPGPEMQDFFRDKACC